MFYRHLEHPINLRSLSCCGCTYLGCMVCITSVWSIGGQKPGLGLACTANCPWRDHARKGAESYKACGQERVLWAMQSAGADHQQEGRRAGRPQPPGPAPAGPGRRWSGGRPPGRACWCPVARAGSCACRAPCPAQSPQPAAAAACNCLSICAASVCFKRRHTGISNSRTGKRPSSSSTLIIAPRVVHRGVAQIHESKETRGMLYGSGEC